MFKLNPDTIIKPTHPPSSSLPADYIIELSFSTTTAFVILGIFLLFTTILTLLAAYAVVTLTRTFGNERNSRRPHDCIKRTRRPSVNQLRIKRYLRSRRCRNFILGINQSGNNVKQGSTNHDVMQKPLTFGFSRIMCSDYRNNVPELQPESSTPEPVPKPMSNQISTSEQNEFTIVTIDKDGNEVSRVVDQNGLKEWEQGKQARQILSSSIPPTPTRSHARPPIDQSITDKIDLDSLVRSFTAFSDGTNLCESTDKDNNSQYVLLRNMSESKA